MLDEIEEPPHDRPARQATGKDDSAHGIQTDRRKRPAAATLTLVLDFCASDGILRICGIAPVDSGVIGFAGENLVHRSIISFGNILQV